MTQNSINIDSVNSSISIQSSSPFKTAIGSSAAVQTTATGNTAVGYNVMSQSPAGRFNTAVGFGANEQADTGGFCTAVGSFALFNVRSGVLNTGVGYNAAGSVVSASEITAVGYNAALLAAQNDSTAVGYEAMPTDQQASVALGKGAGSTGAGGFRNIHIGAYVTGADSATIRIGTHGTQTQCFIAGISVATVTGNAVLIDTTNSKLGTIVSSLRYKKDVINLESHICEKLLHLRPVSFYYKQQTHERRQYGLIAEEVHSLIPEIVTQDHQGNPESVQYHVLPVMLLQVVQSQRKLIDQLTQRLDKFEKANQN